MMKSPQLNAALDQRKETKQTNLWRKTTVTNQSMEFGQSFIDNWSSVDSNYIHNYQIQQIPFSVMGTI